VVVKKGPGAAVTVFILLCAVSCITVNVPIGGSDGEPVTRWYLSWNRPESSGPFLGGALRVKEFGAASDYSLTAMTLKHAEGALSEASEDRWATRIPLMLSEMLAGDLAAMGVFGSVFSYAASPQDMLLVEGFVREFGATRNTDGVWTAILDVDVILLGDRGNTLLFHKNYRLEREMGTVGIPEMVNQLNVLGEIWSETARGDIVSALLPRR